MFVCPSASTGRTILNFNIEGCYKNLQRKSKFGSKWAQISDIYMKAKVCFNVLQATFKRYEITVGSDMQQNIAKEADCCISIVGRYTYKSTIPIAANLNV
jgi:hypothetical protein